MPIGNEGLCPVGSCDAAGPCGKFIYGTSSKVVEQNVNACVMAQLDHQKTGECKEAYFSDEAPEMQVYVGEFCIDDIEVTQDATPTIFYTDAVSAAGVARDLRWASSRVPSRPSEPWRVPLPHFARGCQR